MSRHSTAIVFVVVALLWGILAAAANAATTDSGPPAQAVSALTKQGVSHSQIYGIAGTTQAVRALQVRGQALNQVYHLGQFAPTQALRALQVRSVALDKTYQLGAFAGSGGSSFPWRTIEFAGAAILGVILVAFAAAVGARRRRTVIPV